MSEDPSAIFSWNSNWGLGDKFPAYNISYNDCQEFIRRLNKLTCTNFRMPTEAEWEFAGSSRVERGRAWNYIATSCRVANRGDNSPDYRSYRGLRLAL